MHSNEIEKEETMPPHNPNKFFIVFGAVVAALASMAGVFAIGYSLGGDSADDNFDRANIEQEKWYGYYRDINPKKETQTVTEEMWLTFIPHKEVASLDFVKATSEGEVEQETGNKIDKTWELSGYRSNDYLALAYATSSVKRASGNGIYYLQKSGEIYKGYWIGRDSTNDIIIKGRYLLSKISLSPTQVDNDWPAFKVDIKEVKLLFSNSSVEQNEKP